ncbi:hypothetical protein [Corynebacterium striatum]|uniref:hypothetical protein n=1 Tax=Corynebacterium striatum TaxID=43770 RepID=UPI000627BEA4|nr:hypothetical protein [Corynebacterium striatum]KKO76954.1 hypothetical protein WU85_11610 [Corynebacterium striatum]PXY11586.1 hypothetical protein CKF74_11520 [Corynebacterium striatum]
MFNTMVPQSSAEADSQEFTASEESKKPAVVVEDGILKMTGKVVEKKGRETLGSHPESGIPESELNGDYWILEFDAPGKITGNKAGHKETRVVDSGFLASHYDADEERREKAEPWVGKHVTVSIPADKVSWASDPSLPIGPPRVGAGFEIVAAE